MPDGFDAADIIAEATHEAIDAALTPLLKRIADLEAKLAAPAPAAVSVVRGIINRDNALILTMSDGTTQELGVVVGRDGADVDMAAVGQAVRDEVAKAVAPLLEAEVDEQAEPMTEAFIAPIVERAVIKAVEALPKPLDGKDADPSVVKAMVDEAVLEAVAALPVPKDGQSVTLDEAKPVIEAAVKEAVAAIPAPENGKDADQEAILAEVLRKAEEMVAAIDVAPAVKAEVAEAVAAIPPAKDGVGLAGAMIDRAGKLVVTLTNGETRELGCVVGADADTEELKAIILEAVGKIPVPKDGKDGINWDDLKIEHDGARTVTFRYARGENSKEFTITFPAIVYRGVFKDGETYARGDLATLDGSLWICNAEQTKARPGTGDPAWSLGAKKGRDGKDFDHPPRPRDPRIKS
jgi:hypothetical protein